MVDSLQGVFPKLADFQITRSRSEKYNCIAWG